MEHTMEVVDTKSGKEGTLSFSGQIRITDAAEIREVLLLALSRVDVLKIDLSATEAMDISFVQLICAAHREAYALDKKISVKKSESDHLQEILKNFGYSKRIGCDPAATASCAWRFLH